MNGQTQSFDTRYEESLRGMSAPVYAGQLPDVKMNLAGLSRYAREKGVSVLDLSEEEMNRFGVFPMASPVCRESDYPTYNREKEQRD